MAFVVIFKMPNMNYNLNISVAVIFEEMNFWFFIPVSLLFNPYSKLKLSFLVQGSDAVERQGTFV